jgi:hypothetical protein
LASTIEVKLLKVGLFFLQVRYLLLKRVKRINSAQDLSWRVMNETDNFFFTPAFLVGEVSDKYATNKVTNWSDWSIFVVSFGIV